MKKEDEFENFLAQIMGCLAVCAAIALMMLICITAGAIYGYCISGQ